MLEISSKIPPFNISKNLCWEKTFTKIVLKQCPPVLQKIALLMSNIIFNDFQRVLDGFIVSDKSKNTLVLIHKLTCPVTRPCIPRRAETCYDSWPRPIFQ